MTADPVFDIPARPRRRFPAAGGMEYEGRTLFRLLPEDEPGSGLRGLVADLLEAGPYRYGDFMDLPMPLWLVRDEGTGDVFRVSIRDGAVRLHVLPETDPPGLRRFHERLVEDSGTDWTVERRVDRA